MDFEMLDYESEEKLKELLSEPFLCNKIVKGSAIEHLILNGYIDGISTKTLSDTQPVYNIIGIRQKGKSYFENKKQYLKEQKRITKREWIIAIVSACIGGVIGLIPTLINLFK